MTSRLLHRAACLAAALAFLAAPSVTHADPYTITGSTTGVFSNANGANTVYSDGGSKLTWGTGGILGSGKSSLHYTSTPDFTANPGDNFVLGELTLENGHIWDANELSSATLAITLNLTAPPVIGEGLGGGSLTLASQQLSFLWTYEEVSLPQASDFNSVTFTSGGVEYTLDVLGFGRLKHNGEFEAISKLGADNALLTPNSVKLYGTFTATPAVPEPASIAVVAIAGLFGLGHAIRRRRSAVSA